MADNLHKVENIEGTEIYRMTVPGGWIYYNEDNMVFVPNLLYVHVENDERYPIGITKRE